MQSTNSASLRQGLVNTRVSRQSLCAVVGVMEEGERFEVLALEMGDHERSDFYKSVRGGLIVAWAGRGSIRRQEEGLSA